MMPRYASHPFIAPRVLAVALTTFLAAGAHAQDKARHDLPPYLPPESGRVEANEQSKAGDTPASSVETAPTTKAAPAKSDGRAPSPRPLPPRPLSPRGPQNTTKPKSATPTPRASSRSTAPVRTEAKSVSKIPTASAPQTSLLGAPISAMKGAPSSLLSGEMPAPELRFRQIGEGWQRVTVVAPTVGAAQPVAKASGNTRSQIAERLVQLYGGESGVFFTRGETLKTGSETFLALYKMRVEARDITALFPNGAGAPAVSTSAIIAFFAERPLELSLVNVRTIGALRDIRPFSQSLQAEQVRSIFAAASPSPGAASTRGAAYSALARTNLLRLGGALDLYAKAHKGMLPPMQSFAAARNALLPYAGRLVFSHPAPGASFRFNPVLSRKKISHISQPRDMIAAYEIPASNTRRAVLFLNGTVRFLNATEWRKYSRGSKIK